MRNALERHYNLKVLKGNLNKMNLLQRITLGIGAGVLALAGGCAGESVKQINPAQLKKSAEIYQSPVIKPEYGFRVLNRSGNVDETRPVFKENGNLYVVGFSPVYSDEGFARNMARNDATSRMAQEIYGFQEKINRNRKTRITAGFVGPMRCISTEIIRVSNKKGKQGYVVETLCEVPLKGKK